MNKEFKISKKHLKNNRFDNDVYVLKYRFPLFRFWTEFPVYFDNEDILKDFVQNAYLFNFNFILLGLNDDSNIWDKWFSYKNVKEDFKLTIYHTRKVLGYSVFEESNSYFVIEELCEESPHYVGTKLSEAYEKYTKDKRNGLTNIEEKTYRLIGE